MKKAMEFFKENAVKFFGIDTKIIAPAETQIKNIDIKTNYTDYKFGDEISKQKFKKVISMIEIGKMIRDEGIKEGKAEGKSEILIKQLIKKFKFAPDNYKEKIKKMSEENMDVIAIEIFDMDKIEEIEKYLN